MYQHLKQFWNDEEGATAVEYALIIGLIAIAIIGALEILGGQISSSFEGIAEKLGYVAPESTDP